MAHSSVSQLFFPRTKQISRDISRNIGFLVVFQYFIYTYLFNHVFLPRGTLVGKHWYSPPPKLSTVSSAHLSSNDVSKSATDTFFFAQWRKRIDYMAVVKDLGSARHLGDKLQQQNMTLAKPWPGNETGRPVEQACFNTVEWIQHTQK